jgi:hypothetical protein
MKSFSALSVAVGNLAEDLDLAPCEGFIAVMLGQMRGDLRWTGTGIKS